ncbi:hypothetical protein BKA62DRAFT_773639 [Auriculariales sp. MPI-PUGE-AT-0066]|nr:hypothetical protein BKA62DRAFT_773639 [Auriculariales sp. MPI-PUGE-AT-0066]
MDSRKTFPNEILQQIVAELEVWDLFHVLRVNRSCHALARQHPAWCQNLVLRSTEIWDLNFFHGQWIACMERRRPTDLEIHTLGDNAAIQEKIFVKVMAILPFAKKISLSCCVADPQALWQRFAAIPAPQLESLDIQMLNEKYEDEPLVLPAHPFDDQAPLLKYINAKIDYRSAPVTPFLNVESVCWKLCERQKPGFILQGSNIAAIYPKLRKLVFHGGNFSDLPPNLFDGAVGLWQLEDVEIWGVYQSVMLHNVLSKTVTSSTRRISIDGLFSWGDPTGVGLVSSWLPLGEPLKFKVLKRSEVNEPFTLSLSTVHMNLNRTIELRAVPRVPLKGAVRGGVHCMFTESFASHLANITQLEFDLRFWNQIVKADVPFSAVRTLVIHVADKPQWTMLYMPPDLEKPHYSGLFPLNQSIHTPTITCLKIIGTGGWHVPVEDTWIIRFVKVSMSGFDTTTSSIILRSMQLMTDDGTVDRFSGWPQLIIDDCKVIQFRHS